MIRKKIQVIIKNSISELFAYRLDFYLSILSSAIHVFVLLLMWQVFLGSGSGIFGYARREILTYILLAVLLKGFVFKIKSKKVASEIASGNLNQYLLKPIEFRNFWFFRDLVYKGWGLLVNLLIIAIAVWAFEIDPLFPRSAFFAAAFLIQVLLASAIYFVLSLIISTTTFWYFEHNGWPARFLFEVITDFISGLVFPLTIFGPIASKILAGSPFAFLIYHPLQIYLGQTTRQESLLIIAASVFWLISLYKLSKLFWKRGLIKYDAFGG